MAVKPYERRAFFARRDLTMTGTIPVSGNMVAFEIRSYEIVSLLRSNLEVEKPTAA